MPISAKNNHRMRAINSNRFESAEPNQTTKTENDSNDDLLKTKLILTIPPSYKKVKRDSIKKKRFLHSFKQIKRGRKESKCPINLK